MTFYALQRCQIIHLSNSSTIYKFTVSFLHVIDLLFCLCVRLCVFVLFALSENLQATSKIFDTENFAWRLGDIHKWRHLRGPGEGGRSQKIGLVWFLRRLCDKRRKVCQMIRKQGWIDGWALTYREIKITANIYFRSHKKTKR